ncbi:hypothetical protein VPEG_00046 [Vibrio phage SIO-2]|uniref:hypothetical protein n=1 Tax=Vibrio phage SIO-2 TaxID=700512 RepID=UPI0002357C54|nr:hypothetical protein VPEG_00046 [Vibrio phage SIO-2]AET42197.1 hypothetical protein VPEG_00046 [Vibrio phage SIO-2]
MGKTKLKVLIELLSAVIRIARNPASVEHIEGMTKAYQVSEVQAFQEVRELMHYVRASNDPDHVEARADDLAISKEVSTFVSKLLIENVEPPQGYELFKQGDIQSVQNEVEDTLLRIFNLDRTSVDCQQILSTTLNRQANNQPVTVPLGLLRSILDLKSVSSSDIK